MLAHARTADALTFDRLVSKRPGNESHLGNEAGLLYAGRSSRSIPTTQVERHRLAFGQPDALSERREPSERLGVRRQERVGHCGDDEVFARGKAFDGVVTL